MAKHGKNEPLRLRFSQQELKEPALEKPIRKARKAGAKLDRAESKIPMKKTPAIERNLDARTGKPAARLRFEKTPAEKPPEVKAGLTKKALRKASAMLLREAEAQREPDSRDGEVGEVGVEAARRALHLEQKAFHAGDNLYQIQKSRPYHRLERAERRLDKANLRFLRKEATLGNASEALTDSAGNPLPERARRFTQGSAAKATPHSTRRVTPDYAANAAPGASTRKTARTSAPDTPYGSSPISRWRQRRTIKRQYLAMKTQGHSTSIGARLTGRGKKRVSQTFRRSKRSLVIAGLAFMLFAMVMNGVSSCTPMVQGGFQAVVVSTYPAEEADLLAAERMYAAMESELRDLLNWYEWNHDYDEYHFDLDEIWHDPHALMAIVSAWYGGEVWKADQAYGTLEMLFGWQYQLTEDIKKEIRYRPEEQIGYTTVIDPVTGASSLEPYTYFEDVPFDYYIANVQLINQNLSYAPVYIMSEERVGMYAMYKATLGNYPDLFRGNRYASTLKDYVDYEIPQETLDEYPAFARLIAEAEKYLGYPYVWGGSKPTTSFDCSGFISWVFTETGVLNTGRLGATSLYGVCTPITPEEAQPGDLVFFEGTLPRNEGITHVGLYCGDGMMIHCGDPITYADLNDSYWVNHIFGYARPRL